MKKVDEFQNNHLEHLFDMDLQYSQEAVECAPVGIRRGDLSEAAMAPSKVQVSEVRYDGQIMRIPLEKDSANFRFLVLYIRTTVKKSCSRFVE